MGVVTVEDNPYSPCISTTPAVILSTFVLTINASELNPLLPSAPLLPTVVVHLTCPHIERKPKLSEKTTDHCLSVYRGILRAP